MSQEIKHWVDADERDSAWAIGRPVRVLCGEYISPRDVEEGWPICSGCADAQSGTVNVRAWTYTYKGAPHE